MALDHPYARERRTLEYYRVVREWVESLGPLSLLVDVGSHATDAALFGFATRRLAIDRQRVPDLPGVDTILGDWLDVELPAKADAILCLQVLEHIDPAVVLQFTGKLLRSAATVIVSAPYMEPIRPNTMGHVIQGIDETRLAHLLHGRPFRRARICDTTTPMPRIVAMVKGY